MNNNNVVIKGKTKFNDDELNRQIKEKIGYLNDLKKQFGYDQELINKLALMNVALKENGFEIDDLFYDTLMKTQIFISDVSLADLYKDIFKHEPTFGKLTYGLYNLALSHDVFKENYVPEPMKILVSNKNAYRPLNNRDVYSILIHEIRHVLTTQINRSEFVKDYENIFATRFGLALSFLFKTEGSRHYGININEGFNEKATLNIMNTILKYNNNNLDNNEIKYFLNSLQTKIKDEEYKGIVYKRQMNFLAPLFENEKLMKFAEDVQFNGDIEKVFDLFGDYYAYSDLFDEVIDDFLDEEDTKEAKEKVKRLQIMTDEIAKFKI